MQLRTVLDVNVVDVQKRRNPSKHYVSCMNTPNIRDVLSLPVAMGIMGCAFFGVIIRLHLNL